MSSCLPLDVRLLKQCRVLMVLLKSFAVWCNAVRVSVQAVDMWSLGVIFYTLLGGYHPFHDERQPRLFRRIRDGSFMFHDELWNSTSDQAKVWHHRFRRVAST